MILAAGLGTRLAPLTDWRPKPALPVRGIPVIAPLLRWLVRAGVEEVMVNLHHLPEAMRECVEAHRPPGLAVHFSHETRLLGTGGGLRRVRDFLRESDPCVITAGDMLLDVDLRGVVERHRARGDLATLVLRRDPRVGRFGTIGFAAERPVDGPADTNPHAGPDTDPGRDAGTVRRIGQDFDEGGETAAGVFVGVRCLAARAFDTLPEAEAFEDLRDWLAPLVASGETRVRAERFDPSQCAWEPVGTPAEYLAANLDPPPLGYCDLDACARAAGVRLEPGVVIGRDARIGDGVTLDRVVVWDRETVPDGARLSGGVFAAGRFHPCAPAPGSGERGD